MVSYAFLTDEWIEAARRLRDQYNDRLPEPVLATRINVNITDVPHLDGGVMPGHIDTSEGQTIIEQGHLTEEDGGVDLTVTVDYDTARAAFVTRDQQKLMESFMSGRILVEGDATKLLALQSGPPEVDSAVTKMYEELNALTD